MSETPSNVGASAEPDKLGPDYFSFYVHELKELLSQEDDLLPSPSPTSKLDGRTGRIVGDKDVNLVKRSNNIGKGNSQLDSLLCNGIGARLSDFKKERLRALLQESVFTLSQEVDEMLDPVLAVRWIKSHLRRKKSISKLPAAECIGDAEQHPRKKIKISSPSSSSRNPLCASLNNDQVNAEDSCNEGKVAYILGKGISSVVKKNCLHCHSTESSKWRSGPEGPESLCDTCGIKFGEQGLQHPLVKGQNRESCLALDTGADDEYQEVNDDLLQLLENDNVEVEDLMKKHSDELSTTLGHMEEQLEKLLDTVLSSCRLMTLSEKQSLQKLIQKLPPRNLDRVVEIIQRGNPSGEYPVGEIHVNLEKEDNVTLWRLYYYVEAVKNARKLTL